MSPVHGCKRNWLSLHELLHDIILCLVGEEGGFTGDIVDIQYLSSLPPMRSFDLMLIIDCLGFQSLNFENCS